MAGRPLRVLIVDDSAHARIVTRMVLQAIDAEVRECAHGAAALAELDDWPADLALVDYEMRPLNGADFTRLLREREAADPRRGRTPVLMVTGHSSSGVVLEAVKAGVDAFINKPISTGLLLSRVEKVLAQAAAAARGPRRALAAPPPPAPPAPDLKDFYLDEGPAPARRAG